MSALDIFLLIVCLLAGIRGYVRGFFREVMGLAGMALGSVAAVMYWHPAALLLHRFVDLGPLTGRLFASILTFAAVNVVTHMVAIGFERLARAMFMTSVTRIAGAVVGVGKGVTVSAVVLFLMQTYVPLTSVNAAIDRSTLGAVLAAAARSALGAAAFIAVPAKPHEA